ncbi:MAG: CHRD domain-containing protein [Saprospiraceae bacterium]|nr:CHRD domain-containing protein [Saprospiraceae bacterium]
MLKSYVLFVLLSFCLLPIDSLAQDYQVFLRGSHQPTPVMSTATGDLSVTLSNDSLQVGGDFSGIITGVDTTIAGGAHIHEGLAGQNGSVVFALKPTLSEGLNDGLFEVASNTFVLDVDQQASLAERKLYINIHSNRFGSGEIRGQIIPVADEVYTTGLFGSNQTNSVMSNADGSVIVELHGDTVVVSGSFQNLSSALATDIAGGIHIHQALAGGNGGVLQALNVTISVDSLSADIDAASNTFTVTPEEIANLQNEGWYVNVHSQNWRGGEIRGQLTPVAEVKLRAALSGTNEAPPVTTFAHGKLAIAIRDGNLTVSGSFAELGSDFDVNVAGGAHIHLGMAGQNGSVAFPLTASLNADNRGGVFNPSDNTFPFDEDQLAALMARETYVNIHTTGYPGGELRGQILPESNYFLHAILTGSQQPTAVPTDASGAAIAEVLGGGITLSGSFNNLSSDLATEIANGAHIHIGAVGSNGPVAYPLAPSPGQDNMNGTWQAADNRFGTSPGRQDTMRARGSYINVHTANWQSGEIRGQLMHEARAYFYTPLSGAEEVPAVNTSAAGAAMMEYNGAQAILVGSFDGLSSPVNTALAGGAHIHRNYAGSNGPVLTPLTVTLGDDGTSGLFQISNNRYDVTPGRMDTVSKRGTYINVHSENVGSGELRGQLRPLASKYYLANLRGKNASRPASSTGLGAIIFEQTGSSLIASGSFNDLMSTFATDIAGGAHLHLGMPGMNGGILVSLNSLTGTDGLSALFPADSNKIEMSDTTRMMLETGNSYVNVHSMEVRAGEIRGQALLEINLAPPAVNITEPTAGDTIQTSGDPAAEFAARWDTSVDPNQNKVVYVWQLSATRDFNTPLLTVNTGETNEFVTTTGAVDTLLSTLGIDSGTVVTVYHRVAASDGSLCASSTIDSVYLQRGTITNLQENPYLTNDFTLFPSPTLERIQLDINMKQRAQGQLQILNVEGKVLYQRDLQLFEGNNLIQQQVSSLGGGTYIARLIVNQELAVAKRFMKY